MKPKTIEIDKTAQELIDRFDALTPAEPPADSDLSWTPAGWNYDQWAEAAIMLASWVATAAEIADKKR